MLSIEKKKNSGIQIELGGCVTPTQFPKEKIMEYKLTNCVIKQLSDNIFEIIPNKNIIVDRIYLEECWKFYDEQIKKPFRLLINLKNQHSCSFEGSRDTGTHLLIQKTAFLCNEDDDHTKTHLDSIMLTKRITKFFWRNHTFTDKNEAIKWLSDI